MKHFADHARVVVSKAGGWKNDCPGIVLGDGEPVTTLQGAELYYWVSFDTPEQDVNGDDKYTKAQVLSRYLSEA